MRDLGVKLALSVFTLLTLGGTVSLGQDFSGVEVTTTKLAPNLYMLAGAGGNVGVLVGEEGVFMVDDQYAPMSDKLKAAVAAITEAPLRYLINTHWHFDHTGGNEAFAESGAVLVAHDNVRVRMSRDEFIGLLDMEVPASPAAALPVITFANRLTLHFADAAITAHHVAHAHTDGDAFIHFAEENVIHAGDLFWNGLYPFIDTSSGGGIDGMIKGARRMLALADDQTRIIPGHGPLAGRDDLVAYLDMLETTRARILRLIQDGVSRDAARFKPILEDYDEKWGGGFMKPERYRTIVYDDLARK
ncbi:MAG: MBL fold metallo-hydrolase [Pseudomonadota bacterium]